MDRLKRHRLLISVTTTALLLCGGASFAYDAEFDYNTDGVVDEADTAMITAAFNTSEGEADFDPIFDHDGDGMVGGSDVSLAYEAASSN